MSPLDVDVVRRKLAVITRNLEDLGAVEGISPEAYRADRFRLKATERLLQELIEAAADANAHILRGAGHPAPTDYFQSFTELGRIGVVPQHLADQLAPAAGLRNRLVHEYDKIDDAMVLTAVTRARRDFPSYVASLERYLTSQAT